MTISLSFNKLRAKWQNVLRHPPFAILVGVILIGVAGTIAALAHQYLDPPYAAVQMVTGEVYFGRFLRWPTPNLRNPWVLQQRVVDQTGQPQLSILPLSQAFWHPPGALYLNSKNILSWSYLSSDSDLIKKMTSYTAPQPAASLSNDASGQLPQTNPAPATSP